VRLAAAAIAATVTAVAAPAAAQVARIDAMIERGVTLREAGRDEEALTIFREAWEETRSPRARAQIAMAEHALGRWVEAHVHLREALASTDPWIQRNRAALRGLLAAIERQFGAAEVRGRPAGAQVRVNGSPVGVLPMAAPVRVPSGAVRLEVSAPGYEPMVRELTVRAGGVTRETVQLAPRLAVTAPEPRGGTLRALAWTSASVGAALLVGSAVTFALHESTVGRYDARCLGRSAPVDVETPACRDDRELEGTLRALSTAGLVAGGALGVAAVVMFLAGPSRREGASARVSCGAGPGSVGVACGGTF